MQLLQIHSEPEQNQLFMNYPDCAEILPMTLEFFEKVGYFPPWVGYFVKRDGELCGSAAFKGQPQNGQVEIAYGVFPKFRQQGIGTEICRKLVELSLQTDPSVKVTARTLMEENYSTRILQKNNFQFGGVVDDEEDGEVWEWVYVKL